jgi:alpha-N-arabinofuranosidase
MRYLALTLALTLSAQAQTTLRIDTAHPTGNVSPIFYGLMTEEINHSYDGGLYAEMVRNRTFAHTWDGIEEWNLMPQGNGRATISNAEHEGPSTALPHSLQLNITSASAGNEVGIANSGWWGYAVRPNTTYTGSFMAKPTGITQAHLRLISDDTGAPLAEATVPITPGAWQTYNYTLKTTADPKAISTRNRLVISFDQPGIVNLQLVSLFPPTYNNRPHGFRPDIMELQAAMRPHFLRLPGGNYLEGDTIAERFDWRKTVGPWQDRPTHRSPWNYQSSDGMGLLEMLQWCEDLKIEPVLAVFDGYALKGAHVAGDDLKPFIQEALDEIDYVIGGATTEGGKLRIRDGHPQPFPLHYVEIGNEDNLDHSGSYEQRYAPMEAAIRARFPQLKLIATTRVKNGHPDIIDDHYYKSPEEFFAMVHHYDTVDRNGPKIFVGEWATRVASPTPNFDAALGDAAWMTGMERNSDLIIMASYAPLFTNVNAGAMQWAPDLIGYNAMSAYGSPAYYAQVLFGQHIGTTIAATEGKSSNDLIFWSATTSANNKTLYLKLVNASDRTEAIDLNIPTARDGKATTLTLHAPTRWTTNSIDHPDTVKPQQGTADIHPTTKYALPGNTIQVLDILLR